MKIRYLGALVLMIPLASNAQNPFYPGVINPTKDIQGIAQTIQDNYDKINQHLQRIGSMQADMQLSGIMQASKVDAMNNASANATVRLNQQRTDLHNLEVAQQAQPAMYACAPIGVSINLEEAQCEQVDLIAERAEVVDRSSLSSAPSLQYAVTGIPADDDSQSTPLQRPRPEDLSLESIPALMGSPASHDLELTTVVQEMVSALLPAHQPNQARRQWTPTQTVLEMQVIAQTNLPRKAVESVAARRAESGGLSEAGAIQAYGGEHFSDERISDLTTNPALSEDAMWRERYTSRAFLVWRSINEFELALELEVLLAVRLASAVDDNSI